MTSTQPTSSLPDFHGSLKPKLRGVVHTWSVLPMALAGVFLIIASPTTTTRVSVAVYALAVTGMLTASASYHRLRVSDRVRVYLRRLDHSMIGVAVAGTYTPVIALTLTGALRISLLALLWVGAFGTMLVSFSWPNAPSYVRAGVYLALGWAGAVVTPWLWSKGGAAAFTFVILGAVFYSLGAVVYALRKPNPWPTVYGFHEIFHTFVVLAAALHFVAIVFVIQNTTA